MTRRCWVCCTGDGAPPQVRCCAMDRSSRAAYPRARRQSMHGFADKETAMIRIGGGGARRSPGRGGRGDAWGWWIPVSLGLLLLLPGCGQDPLDQIPPPDGQAEAWGDGIPSAPQWNVLLLTLDTARRDRLGCYGHLAETTPHLDRLAEEGILFENAIASCPITLPSHATILTGLDPPEHGVRNNGTFVLDDAIQTLPEVLHARGYQTYATIGAFPVAARFGLDQGFDLYDDDFPAESRTRDYQTLQRTAAQVTDVALEQIAAHRDSLPGAPFFQWVHYFDPHFPYDPPEAYRARFGDYDGEVAYMDAQIGRLLEGLEHAGLRENSWILCVADHGEALGEHQEETHGMLLYGATTYVPCILVPPRDWEGYGAARVRGRRVPEAVGLRDLAPTICNLLGLPAGELPASGISLVPLIAGAHPGPRVCYMETLMPFLDYGWCELRGVRTRRWCYVRAPQVELYDLHVDPEESVNVASDHPDITRRLEAWCEVLGPDAGAVDVAPPDPETIAKLRSLGYVAAGGSRGEAVNQRDPKKLMHVFDRINDALALLGLQQTREARRLLDEALEADPGNPEALRVLGVALLRLGASDEAVELYTGLLERFPGDVELQLNLGRALLQSEDADRAAELFAALLETDPDNEAARNLYPRALRRAGRVAEARRFLEREAERADEEGPALAMRAMYEWEQGDLEEAHRLAAEALALDPALPDALALVGEWNWRRAHAEAEAGHHASADSLLRLARGQMSRALELDPLTSLAAFRMAWAMGRDGDLEKAEELYRRALAENPSMIEARVNLANLLNQTRRPGEALRHYEMVLERGAESPDILVNYGVALINLGRTREAGEAWERALALDPEPEVAEGIRANLRRLRGER
ncbi:MAG: sulfatase-like hydrolase/transferase [Candidatus Eisenbacteria bacterium]|nr:sulfatase-like hydrolase/transferase [Candidatus Eisenbacteria bacterium]